jgi:hypothetical protein
MPVISIGGPTGLSRMYVAFENGANASHVPGCCNNYIRFDLVEWLGPAGVW